MRHCTRCGSAYTAHVAHCSIDGGLLAESDLDPLVGRSIDRYKVLERLGRGGMGCVYRVAHLVLEHEYAMKVLYGDIAADMRVVERFRLEAKSISRIRHPNVVSVTDFGVSPEGLTFLVMERIEGQTLGSLIAEEAPFKPARAIDIALQIAAGLEEAHRLELVHRDVKSFNIMITREGELERVKLLDFGIVSVAETSPMERITTTERCLGTPHYMSPEQILGNQALTPAADLYSLGVVLFEMLSGRFPFDGGSPMEIFIKQIAQPPPELPPSGGLELVVRWLLEKSAAQRPQSAREVINELERIRRSCEDLPAQPRTSRTADTVEILEGEDPLLDTAKDQLRRAVETAPTPISLRFEPPVTYHDPSSLPPVGPAAGHVLVGYEVLREKLDRLQAQLNRVRLMRAPSELADLARRCEEMLAAVRPGLTPFRYGDLASKILRLEDDLRALRD